MGTARSERQWRGYRSWGSEGHCKDFDFFLREVGAMEGFEPSSDVVQFTSNGILLATG